MALRLARALGVEVALRLARVFQVGFLGNSSQTCSAICSSHAGVCRFAVNLTNFNASTCPTVASDVDLQLCYCSTS